MKIKKRSRNQTIANNAVSVFKGRFFFLASSAIKLAGNQMSGLSFPRIAKISAKSAQPLLNGRRTTADDSFYHV